MSERTPVQKQTAPPTLTPAHTGLLQRKCACRQRTISGGECDACGRKKQALQRHVASQRGHADVPEVVREVLGSPGRPLETATRSLMESRFGHDFSRVRIHTDARAAESAQAVSASAYAVGSHIVFGEGQYAPNVRGGRTLLAHELTHTVQQGGANSMVNQIGRPEASSEQEASQTTERVISGAGGPFPTLHNDTGVVRRHVAAQTKALTPGDAVSAESQPEEQGGREPKEAEIKPDICESTVKYFEPMKQGVVEIYQRGEHELVVQTGTAKSEDPTQNNPGVGYAAAVQMNPIDCAKLEFVQNIQTERVITFKDGSKLELATGLMLDRKDPYPTELLPAEKLKKLGITTVVMQDSPEQGTGGVFGSIDTISIKESFKLFLRATNEGKKKGRIIGLADWGWEAKAVTENKNDADALLKVESGKIDASKGATNNITEKPKLSPRIQDQRFKVVGKSDSYASKFRELFKPKK
jgi:Domain of unknown function (DUF4157)